jgi:SAM-dependent methyltransferase
MSALSNHDLADHAHASSNGTLAAPTPFDENKHEAFAQRMLDVINGAALALFTSIGHRTGLFDAMSDLPSSTSTEIAEAAGLNERYVREWLNGMVAGRVLDYDPAARTYALPAEHAAWLTRGAAPNNLAVTTQFVGMMGSVETRVIDRFRHGGGVPYDDFPCFHSLMAEESSQTVVAALTDHILPLMPGVEDKLAAGARVLDVGCGSGRAICRLAQLYPDSRFRGLDLCDGAVAAARAHAESLGLSNVEFIQGDATQMAYEREFDLVLTFDAVHDQAHPAIVLAGIRRALKPDGLYLMQDIGLSSRVENNIDHPVGPFTYCISCMHCMTVSLAQGGEGLGAAWGVELAREMLDDAGFTNIEQHALEHDFMNAFFVCRPGSDGRVAVDGRAPPVRDR